MILVLFDLKQSESAFMDGIGAYFALANAMKAFKRNLEIDFSAPLTPEKVLLTFITNRTIRRINV